MKAIAWLALCAAAVGWADVPLLAAEAPVPSPPPVGAIDAEGAKKEAGGKQPERRPEKLPGLGDQGDTPLGPPFTGPLPQVPKDSEKKDAQALPGYPGVIVPPGGPTPVATSCDGQYQVLGAYPVPAVANTQPQLAITAVDPTMGIYFLRPYWSRRDFSISVPGGNGAGAVLFSDTRDVARDYTVAPVLNLKLQFTDLDLTFKGVQYALASTVDQTINTGTTNASLAGKSSLTIREATAGEVSVRLPCPDCLEGCFGGGGEARFGLGPYYLYLDQTYIATLVNGANKTSLNSSQNFEGLGLVGALHLRTGQCPFGSDPPQNRLWYWRAYSDVTGAILMGTNKRISDLSVTGATGPSIRNSSTDYIPLGILEFGVEVGKKNLLTLGGPRAGYGGCGYGYGPISGDAGFRLGAVAQVIGDVGLTSAASPDNRALNNGSLYLVGFQATFYLNFPPKPDSY